MRRLGERKNLSFGTMWWKKRPLRFEFSRIAVAVSAQYIPKATTRNRIRRKVQASLKPLLSESQPPCDIFIHIRNTAFPGQQALQAEIKTILKSIEIRSLSK